MKASHRGVVKKGARQRASGIVNGIPAREVERLRLRLREAEETIQAIQSGGVDALVVGGEQGPRVFTLEGSDRAYRLLIESMNEGALTLTPSGVILYANECFARMVQKPLEHVIGGIFQEYISTDDSTALGPTIAPPSGGSRLHLKVRAADGSRFPAHISIRPLTPDSYGQSILGVVVTDMTETRRSEERLRALSHHLVRSEETERGRVAVALHDNIAQLLAAVLVRVQVLAAGIPRSESSSREEALQLVALLGKTAEEVERITSELRPGALELLGLVSTMRAAGRKFTDRAGVPLKLTCSRMNGRLPADTELALYRILQEALKNIEGHARARHVTVNLARRGSSVHLSIKDDGIGFDPEHDPGQSLGIVAMRERAFSLGGALRIQSSPGAGTTIEACIPLPAIPPRRARVPRRAADRRPLAPVRTSHAAAIQKTPIALRRSGSG